MNIDDLKKEKKDMLYGTKADKNNALNCLAKYRECIELYRQIEFISLEIENKHSRYDRFKLYCRALQLSKKLDRIWYEWKLYESSYNASIPISADVPLSTVFPHQLSNIFISAHSKIGEGCIIFQGVTIGSNTLSDSKGHGSPIIGNNVYIGSGATIVGNITIGDNVRIGANTTVTKSVDADTTCVSHPFVMIKHKGKKENRKW